MIVCRYLEIVILKEQLQHEQSKSKNLESDSESKYNQLKKEHSKLEYTNKEKQLEVKISSIYLSSRLSNRSLQLV